MPDPHDPTERLRALSGTCDPRALAYLWIAIESNCNILVFSGEAEARGDFINAMCALVPGWQMALDLRKSGNQHVNFIRALDAKIAVKDAVSELMPDRIITERMEKGLFQFCNSGISIMSALRHPDGSVVKSLLSGPFGISESEISNLDVSVFLGGSQDIGTITEYRWLSRAEVDPCKRLAGRFENSMIAAGGTADEPSIIGSKVIGKLAKRNLMTIGEAMQELGKRAAFLSCMASSNLGIDRYLEVK